MASNQHQHALLRAASILLKQQHAAEVQKLESEQKLHIAETGAFSMVNHGIKRTMINSIYWAGSPHNSYVCNC